MLDYVVKMNPFGGGDGESSGGSTSRASSRGGAREVSGAQMLSSVGPDASMRRSMKLDDLPGDLRAMVLDDMKKGG